MQGPLWGSFQGISDLCNSPKRIGHTLPAQPGQARKVHAGARQFLERFWRAEAGQYRQRTRYSQYTLGAAGNADGGVETLPVMTTLHPHMSALCPSAWPAMGIDTQYAQTKLPDVKRRAALFAEKGFNQTYTCYPAMVGSLPKKATTSPGSVPVARYW